MIKILIMDVDGTLTDGKIYMSDSGEIMKAFNIKDGYGLVQLRRSGVLPVILTGRTSKIVSNRAAELGIEQVYQGVEDKVAFLHKILEQNQVRSEEAAYIGDDDNDIPCMRICGLVGCPADASKNVKAIAHFISTLNGGQGAVREFTEYIIAQNGEET